MFDDDQIYLNHKQIANKIRCKCSSVKNNFFCTNMFIDTYQAIIIAGYLLVMGWTGAGFVTQTISSTVANKTDETIQRF